MKITIQDIANHAGVSRGTVDRALNKRGRIDSAVAENILKIADELGYKKKPRTKKGKKTTYLLGVLIYLSRSSFMIAIRQGIEDARKELSIQGIEVIVEECLMVDEKQQEDAIIRLREKGIHGLAIMPVDSKIIRERINELVDGYKIPVITFNSDIIGTKRTCFVGLDNKKSGKTAAGLMGMLTRGEGKILGITGNFGNSVNSMRIEGFVEELKNSFPKLELVGIQSSFDDASEVEKIISTSLATYSDLDGIFIVSAGQGGIVSALDSIKHKKSPFIILYDLIPRNILYLQEDYADFLIDQDGYTQGYRPLMLLTSMICRGETISEEFQYTDINIKTKYNI